MKKGLKITWNILQVIIIIYVILVTSLLFFENKFGFSQFGKYVIHNISKLDKKNISNVNEGDLVIIKSESDIKKGDIIYYYATYNEKYIIVSEEVKDVQKDGKNYLYTINKGNPMMISSTRVIGKSMSNYPYIGKILNTVESRTGFVFYVLLPIVIVFGYQVYQFLLILSYEKVVEIAEREDAIADDEIL